MPAAQRFVPRVPRFSGPHFTWPMRSQLVARCSACDAPVYVRINEDCGELAIEHTGGACANWTEHGELRVAKVMP